METMTNELTVIPRTIGMVTRMMDAVNIEDAVIVSEEEQKEHPNFIESNTSGITLEELERNCIVPSFGDNQLTISHQKFIHQVEDAAKVYFTGENFGNTEIRVSHKIHLAHHTLTGLAERHHGRGGAVALRVGDNDCLAAFHHGYAGIGRTKVDTDNFRHNDCLLYIDKYLLLTVFDLAA